MGEGDVVRGREGGVVRGKYALSVCSCKKDVSWRGLFRKKIDGGYFGMRWRVWKSAYVNGS